MSEHIIEVTDDNYEDEVLQSQLPVLIDFWAPWCAPCSAFMPTYEKLAEMFKGKVKFCKINTDENPASSTQKFTFRSIPFFVLLNQGEVFTQVSGPQTLGSFKKLLEDHLDGQSSEDTIKKLLQDPVYRASYFQDAEPTDLKRLIDQQPELINEAFPNGMQPSTFALSFAVTPQKRDLILSYNPKLTVHDLAYLGRAQDLQNQLKASPELLNQLDYRGFSALFSAVASYREHLISCALYQGEKQACIELLISKGADVDLRGENAATPISIAVAEGDKELVQYLLESGADIHQISTRNSETLLHIAIKKEQFEMVEFLIDRGINPTRDSATSLNILDSEIEKANRQMNTPPNEAHLKMIGMTHEENQQALKNKINELSQLRHLFQ